MPAAASALLLAGGCAALLSACTLLIDSESLTGGSGNGRSGGASSGGASSGGASNGGASHAGTSGTACIPAAVDASCDGLDQNCQATLDEPACPVGCTGSTFRGASYMACSGSAPFSQAEVLCQGQGMHLVKIDSVSENSIVVQLAQSLGSYIWIGASDLEQNSTFAWLDGTELYKNGAAVGGVYQNFANAEPVVDPARHCVQLHDAPPGYWYVTRCTESKQFICERY